MEQRNGLFIPETTPVVSDEDVQRALDRRAAMAAEIAANALDFSVYYECDRLAVATLAAAILAQWPTVRKELEAAK